MKKKYFEKILDVFNGDVCEAEDAAEFVYGMYEDVTFFFKKEKRLGRFTKKLFVNTFVRLYSDIGGNVYELSIYTFAKCVNIMYREPSHTFTEDEIEELSATSVNSAFVS